MARSRNIKPGFFTNDLLAEIHPFGRILFAGLWTIADREGRLENRPKKIKAQVLPYDDCDIDALIQDLSCRGFILCYTDSGNGYIQVLNWAKHQQPHCKEPASTIPAPSEHQMSTVQNRCEHRESTEVAPPDSLNLIPDTLNPVPPPPPRKRRGAVVRLKPGGGFQEYPPETVQAVNAILDATPGKDSRDRAIRADGAVLTERVNSLLQGNPALTPEILIQAWRDYLATGPMMLKAPQYFFGAEADQKGGAHWRPYAAAIWHQQAKAAREAGEAQGRASPPLEDATAPTPSPEPTTLELACPN